MMATMVASLMCIYIHLSYINIIRTLYVGVVIYVLKSYIIFAYFPFVVVINPDVRMYDVLSTRTVCSVHCIDCYLRILGDFFLGPSSRYTPATKTLQFNFTFIINLFIYLSDIEVEAS